MLNCSLSGRIEEDMTLVDDPEIREIADKGLWPGFDA